MSDIQSAPNDDRAGFGQPVHPPAEVEVLVADVMIIGAPAVPAWIPVAAARKIALLKSAHNLVVSEHGRLIGILSAADLCAAPDADIVGAWTRTPPVSLHPNTPAPRARHLMIKSGLSCLPVMAGSLLVGLVTRDALERAMARARRRVMPPLPAPAGGPATAHRRVVAA